MYKNMSSVLESYTHSDKVTKKEKKLIEDTLTDLFSKLKINTKQLQKKEIEEMAGYVKPHVTTISYRQDDHMYKRMETIRVLHSNPLVAPSNTDIIRAVYKFEIERMKRENPQRYEMAKQAVESVNTKRV